MSVDDLYPAYESFTTNFDSNNMVKSLLKNADSSTNLNFIKIIASFFGIVLTTGNYMTY